MNQTKVICLCANCGGEIAESDGVYEINDELWCRECAADMYPAIYEDYNDE